ncbi:MAG TPA: Ig-like domain-containing protein [Gemmatimonadales bacterium]|nr:Ig-like domain-containing protein [Gemmatimonadales bacterium]
MRGLSPLRWLAVRVFALGLGTAVIGSCGGGGDASGPPDDPDPPAVAQVELAPSSLSLGPGQSGTLVATLRAADGSTITGRSIAWSTDDPGIATVAGGTVTAVAPGEAAITATSEGRSGSATVVVSDVPVATVTVTPSPATVTVGKTAQLVATAKAQDGAELPGRPIAWITSDAGIATVSAAGLVTGVAVGDATITATSEGQSGTTQLTVSLVPVDAVEIAPDPISVAAGATLQLTATARDAQGDPLPGRSATWSSADTDIATVSPTGLLTGVSAGSTAVTATIEGVEATAVVTVTGAAGVVREWVGGAAGGPSDWARAGNWNPAGAPSLLDLARVPPAADPAVLSGDVQVARLVVAGGQTRTAGHRLVVRQNTETFERR